MSIGVSDLGVRPNSNQARICVLGFSANRVWLVNRFNICLLPAIGSGRAGIVDMESIWGQPKIRPEAGPMLSPESKKIKTTN